MPERISALPALASNISWSWSRKARALFRAIDYPLWALTRHNPIEVLRRVDPDSLVARAGDPEFLRLYDAAVAAAREASGAQTWFAKQFAGLESQHHRVLLRGVRPA